MEREIVGQFRIGNETKYYTAPEPFDWRDIADSIGMTWKDYLELELRSARNIPEEAELVRIRVGKKGRGMY